MKSRQLAGPQRLILLRMWQQCAAIAGDDAAALDDKATRQVCADRLSGIFCLDKQQIGNRSSL
jgi:hypothetical protein